MCSKTPLDPRLFTAVLPKRLYILLYKTHTPCIHDHLRDKSHRSHHGFIKRARQTPSLLTHPFAFPLVSSLAFAASFLPPVFISSFLNFLGYARGKYLVLQPRFYIGCQVFDSWFNIRSGHMYFQGQYFLYFSPFVCSIFLAIFIALVVFVFNSFLFILFLQPLPGFQSY